MIGRYQVVWKLTVVLFFIASYPLSPPPERCFFEVGARNGIGSYSPTIPGIAGKIDNEEVNS